jgi:hypothetical protein
MKRGALRTAAKRAQAINPNKPVLRHSFGHVLRILHIAKSSIFLFKRRVGLYYYKKEENQSVFRIPFERRYDEASIFPVPFTCRNSPIS